MDSVPPIPVIPHGSQAVWLKDDDSVSSTVSRNSTVASLTNELQAVSLNEDQIATSPQVSGLSFFQLLENVSPHVQSVLLNKCTVLELSSLAATSSLLRKGALETMAKRSLNVRIGCLKFRGQIVRKTAVTVMFIDDISDPSRNMSVEFCNCQSEEYKCDHWTKIQKLILFCGHASVLRIDVETNHKRFLDAVMSPNRFAMRSAHTAPPESSNEEFFVEKFTSDSCDGAKQLNFISPSELKLEIGYDYDDSPRPTYFDLDCSFDFDTSYSHTLYDVLNSRGMVAAKSISVNFSIEDQDFECVDDELMLKLSASSIVFYSNVVYLYSRSYWPLRFSWTPVGVSRFIEQWLRGSRAVKKVTSGVYLHYETVAWFSKRLVSALGKLEPAPQVVSSVNFDEDLIGRLQILDGKMIYEDALYFNLGDAAVIRVTAPDGQELTIAVTKAWDVEEESDTRFAFIDIFPSNQ